jgi:hypothetical protein
MAGVRTSSIVSSTGSTPRLRGKFLRFHGSVPALLNLSSRACSKLLWRSEIEEDPEKNNNLLNLSQRQENREPCECNPLNRQVDR